MWKESYKIGVDLIDKQHKELFEATGKLLQVIEQKGDWNQRKDTCKAILDFLKSYVVKHFKAEEAYQESIQYENLEQHKKVHQKFTLNVLEYEKRLIESSYEYKLIKQFAGMLSTWLIYHVADEDQKFARFAEGKKEKESNVIEKEKTFLQCCLRSISSTLEKMIGMNPKELSGKSIENKIRAEDICIAVGIIGEIQGNIVYGFSKEFSFQIVEIMTGLHMEQMDEMVCSAMAELSNIISGNTTIAFSKQGFACDITTPVVMQKQTEDNLLKKNLLIHSKLGDFTMGATF